MKFDRKFLLFALAYAIVGIVLGIYMASSQNHEQHVTHAHVLLLGFVMSFLYGVIHKLWLDASSPRLALVQLVAHQLGVLGMCAGLFLLYGGLLRSEQLEPVLGVASIAVLLGAVLMFFMTATSRDSWV
jgi:hypothetical protein